MLTMSNARNSPYVLAGLPPDIRQASIAMSESSDTAKILAIDENIDFIASGLEGDEETQLQSFSLPLTPHGPHYSLSQLPSQSSQPSQASLDSQAIQYHFHPSTSSPAASQLSGSVATQWDQVLTDLLVKAVLAHNPNLALTMQDRGRLWDKVKQEYKSMVALLGYQQRLTDSMWQKFLLLKKKREKVSKANVRASGILNMLPTSTACSMSSSSRRTARFTAVLAARREQHRLPLKFSTTGSHLASSRALIQRKQTPLLQVQVHETSTLHLMVMTNQ